MHLEKDSLCFLVRFLVIAVFGAFAALGAGVFSVIAMVLLHCRRIYFVSFMKSKRKGFTSGNIFAQEISVFLLDSKMAQLNLPFYG